MPLDIKLVRRWIDAECDSTADAARRLGMHRESLLRLLRDGTDVRLSTLEQFADAIGVEPAELIRRAKSA